MCAWIIVTGMGYGADYGDAPDADQARCARGELPPELCRFRFPTLQVNNGARHLDISMAWLGRNVTSEGAPKQVDEDEDDFLETLEIRNHAWDGPLYLNALVDKNGDLDWDDPGEWVIRNRQYELPHDTSISVAVPEIGAAIGVWFRITLTGAPLSNYIGKGTFEVGETEDYFFPAGGAAEGPTPTKPPFIPTPTPGKKPPTPQGPGGGGKGGGGGDGGGQTLMPRPITPYDVRPVTGAGRCRLSLPQSDACEKCIADQANRIYVQQCLDAEAELRRFRVDANHFAEQANKLNDAYGKQLAAVRKAGKDPAKDRGLQDLLKQWRQQKAAFDDRKRRVNSLEQTAAQRLADYRDKAINAARRLCDDICRNLPSERKKDTRPADCTWLLKPTGFTSDLMKLNILKRKHPLSSSKQSDELIKWILRERMTPYQLYMRGKELRRSSAKLMTLTMRWVGKPRVLPYGDCAYRVVTPTSTKDSQWVVRMVTLEVDEKVYFWDAQAFSLNVIDVVLGFTGLPIEMTWLGINAVTNAVATEWGDLAGNAIDVAISIGGHYLHLPAVGRGGSVAIAEGVSKGSKRLVAKLVAKELGKELSKEGITELVKQAVEGENGGPQGSGLKTETGKDTMWSSIKNDFLGVHWVRVHGTVTLPIELCLVSGDVVTTYKTEIVETKPCPNVKLVQVIPHGGNNPFNPRDPLETTTPTTPTTTPGGPTAETYRVTFNIEGDPAGHDPFIGLTAANPHTLTATVTGSTIRITGPAPFVAVTGTVNNGNFTAAGSGTVAGFTNIQVRMSGNISTDGRLNGTYIMGSNGGLPQGQAATYVFTGQRT